MCNCWMRQHCRRLLLSALLMVGLSPLVGQAEQTAQTSTVIKDVLGREVRVNTPVQRVMLGEGRQLYLVAMLDREDPAKRIVAWRRDLIQSDPATWHQYRDRFPQLAKIPTFDGTEKGTFDVEQAVSLKPDVIIMNIEAQRAIVDAGYDRILDSVGIPIVYVDFRYHPLENTAPTLRLFGKLFHQEARADAFLAFREAQLKRVSDVLAAKKPRSPRVFIERLGGYTDECCLTFGRDNFGKFVQLAGGDNVAAKNAPNTFMQMHSEQVIVENPEVVVITSGNFEAFVPGGRWIGLGPGQDMTEGRKRLEWFLGRPAYTNSIAKQKRAFHAIWHQFYNGPYDFIAIQQLAEWFHPDLFRDLNADDTFRQLHEQFLPVDYQSGYFVSLTP
ncbi:ABC transporter substrate-binding protein [Pectobacterium punjabense]|uniref:ABC transporter substrate-binding protein n=1 Tax=Pectobacterium punjabense TaxID=2108399 RepID=A0ABX6L6T8_9GAMM|nr:ABC transporter substrate-binding protein [Pectobacterium punjabense]MBS4431283.1 ABC transporter substrate-binding protein [Pectobacterium punjabense]MDG0799015.1 ABC transporter substrate-binding protein [Pectobacterium punjabense]PTA64722.1 ABC transporter substrate-binding protein [Pectobacterium punjabense]QJA21991.1 ABC transporter substrate-binding protein [Pectobacterium punjabense]